MADWVGAQGQVNLAKKTLKHPHLWRHPRNPQIRNEKKIFLIYSLRLAESVEGLNSSLAQSPGELLSRKFFKNCKKVAHAGLKGWNAECKAYSYTVLENKPICLFCWNESKSSLSVNSGIASFKNVWLYFQFHETNLIDGLRCGNALPPSTFCHFSLSSHRICEIIHP